MSNSNPSEMNPVFLLGAGRSGTKFLRDILGASSNVAVIPYDVGYVWRYGNENFSHDELMPDMLTDSIKEYVKKTLPQLTKNNSSNTDVTLLIEKSVPNTLRPAFLHAIYPDAKFIHLIRDGRAVTESAMRLWKAPPEKGYLLKKLRYFPWKNYRYAIWYIINIIKGKLGSGRGQQTWGPRYKGIDSELKSFSLEVICARQWKKCVEVCLSQLSHMDQKNILEVRYENIMESSYEIDKICHFIGISDSKIVIDNYEAKVNRNHEDKWKYLLNEKQLKQINLEIKSVNTVLGYV